MNEKELRVQQLLDTAEELIETAAGLLGYPLRGPRLSIAGKSSPAAAPERPLADVIPLRRQAQ